MALLEKRVGSGTEIFIFIVCASLTLFLIVYTYNSEKKDQEDIKSGVQTQAMIAEKETKDDVSSNTNVIPSGNGSVMVVPSTTATKKYIFHLYADKKIYELNVKKKIFDQYKEKDKIDVTLYGDDKIKLNHENQ